MIAPPRSLAVLWVLLADVSLCSAQVLQRYDIEGAAAWRAELPDDLAEISGLAFTPGGVLLAHGDERGVVWRLDVPGGRPAGRFGLGEPSGVLDGDFEDIAVAGERIFLVKSSGEIYEGRVVPDGQIGMAARRTVGLEGGCDVEGLAWDEPTRSLLLLCKSTRSKRWKDHVVIIAVSIETWRFEPKPRILIPRDQLRRATGGKEFDGSGFTRHPRTGTYLLVAGPQRAIAEVNAAGVVLGGRQLPKARHRQPEGIAVGPDLTLLIGDEAAGHVAAVTGYAYRQ